MEQWAQCFSSIMILRKISTGKALCKKTREYLPDSPLHGNNDMLIITRLDVIENMHLEFLKTGANILEINTFNANRISQSDYIL